MKKMYQNIGILMILILALQMNVSAADTSKNLNQAYVPCPAYSGKHQMRPQGLVDIYIGNTRVMVAANLWVCQYCGDVIGCEYDPVAVGKLGKYGYSNTSRMTITNSYSSMRVDKLYYNSGNLSTDPFFQSFYFRYPGSYSLSVSEDCN